MPSLVSILPSDLARTRGGAERYAFQLQAALSAQLPHWRIRGVVAASEDAELHVPAGWSAVGGSAVTRLPPGDAISARAALRIARGADVVFCHQWRSRATSAMRASRLLARRRHVLAIDYGGGSRFGYYAAWAPLPAVHLGAHITSFEESQSPVRAPRHAVIRGGVDARRFRALDAEPTTDFLMVGRFLPYKGQLRFLECLPDGARARLIGPSDSEDPDYRRAVLDRAGTLGVDVHLDAPDIELIDAYQHARYTVQVPVDPRRYQAAAPPELLGLTMLEAMACGSVPICPRTGASAEFVSDDHTGLTYEAGSARSLREVLARAQAGEARRAVLRRGALREATRWTWDNAARELLAAAALG